MKCMFKDLTEACTKINVIQIRLSHCVPKDYHLNKIKKQKYRGN